MDHEKSYSGLFKKTTCSEKLVEACSAAHLTRLKTVIMVSSCNKQDSGYFRFRLRSQLIHQKALLGIELELELVLSLGSCRNEGEAGVVSRTRRGVFGFRGITSRAIAQFSLPLPFALW